MGSPVPKFCRPNYVLLWGFLASSQNEIMRKFPHLLMIEDVQRKNSSKKVVSLLSDATPAQRYRPLSPKGDNNRG